MCATCISDLNYQCYSFPRAIEINDVKNVFLIIPLWLWSKHSTKFKVFFDPRIEISMSNNPHYHILKVSPVSRMARYRCQSLTFQCNFLRLLAAALLFRRAAVNLPSISVNVNFANGQTKRIFVPYSRKLDSKLQPIWNLLSFGQTDSILLNLFVRGLQFSTDCRPNAATGCPRDSAQTNVFDIDLFFGNFTFPL
jgi:hypothetical protein